MLPFYIWYMFTKLYSDSSAINIFAVVVLDLNTDYEFYVKKFDIGKWKEAYCKFYYDKKFYVILRYHNCNSGQEITQFVCHVSHERRTILDVRETDATHFKCMFCQMQLKLQYKVEVQMQLHKTNFKIIFVSK